MVVSVEWREMSVDGCSISWLLQWFYLGLSERRKLQVILLNLTIIRAG